MDTASLIAEIKSLPAHDVRCERILVAIDGSHASFHAAAWAIDIFLPFLIQSHIAPKARNRTVQAVSGFFIL